MAFPYKRIIGIHIYYTHSEEGFETFWSLGKLLWKRGFVPAMQVVTVDEDIGTHDKVLWQDNPTANNYTLKLYDSTSTQEYYEFKSMPKLDTFESINGYSPFNSTTSVRYKTHTIAGRRSFIGNIAVKDTPGLDTLTYYNDRIVVSPVNQLDTFPYPDNILDLDVSDGDEITALVTVGDKILQFKRNIMYVMNISTSIPSEFFVEGRYKFQGAKSREHIVETSQGIFWVNENGAYLYDGEDLKNLHLSEDGENMDRKISLDVWKDFISDDSLVGYNKMTEECMVVKKNTMGVDSDADSSEGDCWILNLITKSWVYGRHKFYVGDGRKLTNFRNTGDDGVVSFFYNGHSGDMVDNSGVIL